MKLLKETKYAELKKLNDAGAGIFIQPNESV
jgi:hypothetical protein